MKPTQFVRGTIVGGNDEAVRMDLVQGREWGTVTSQKPHQGLVTVHWHGTGVFESWHTNLLEIIDRAGDVEQDTELEHLRAAFERSVIEALRKIAEHL